MRALKHLLAVVTGVLLALLGLALGLSIWAGMDSSLAATLDTAARWLPAGQTLEARDVSGSLRTGGRIGWLRWRQGELSVEARNTELAWTLRGLLDGQLRLSRLAVEHLRIDDRRPPEPLSAPTNLTLGLQVDAPFAVAELEWAGPPPLKLTDLSGHYVFDGAAHRLADGRVRVSSGHYLFSGTLQAQSPMALSLDVQGDVLTSVPGSRQSLTVRASAQARGPLAGQDAVVDVSARLVPGATKQASQAMQATVNARIQPWHAQPVASAEASWQALDLAALWPQAPRTLLQGRAAVTPRAAGWLAEAQLVNAAPGPWDRGQLPVDSLQARATHVDGQWVIESLTARAAGGQVQARGQARIAATPPATPRSASVSWQGRATFEQINPAAVDSRLAPQSLDGHLDAHLTDQALVFETRIEPSQAGRAPPAATAGTRQGKASPGAIDPLRLRLKSFAAQGRWASPTLTLQTLQLHTDDEQLQASGSVNLSNLAAEGQLGVRLPGAEASVSGQISSATGLGDLQVRIMDAGLTSRWLARWPGMPPALARAAVQGTGDLTAQWRGGWQQQGQALQVKAELSLPRLEVRTAGAAPAQAWRLGPVQADVSGSLAALRLTASARAESGSRRFDLQAQATGGRVADGSWQTRVETLRLTTQDSRQTGTWTAQLDQALGIDWKPGANARSLEVAAGQASLTGPVPGTARLGWQSARWSQGASGQTQWRSQGRLQELPLGWLERLAGAELATLGLSGDLVLGGEWDLAVADTLRLRASLERSRGDLRLQPEDERASALGAGLREARISLAADGEDLNATLRWDSERGGQVQAAFKSRLRREGGGWAWPADTPVAGEVRAQMPRLGLWSVLAPPGWRLSGTLDANATLGGTRGAPQWRGTLNAGDLAVRSVVNGIDFRQGRLRASLNGQRLDIDEFSLKGASTERGDGGLLSLKGFVLWPAADTPASAGLTGLRMELDALAEGLRASTRADRRLAVSGQLTARLAEARLTVRGNLKADRARFILPDDTAPTLGADVVVNATRAGAAPAAASGPSGPAGTRVTQDIAITLDLGPDFRVRGHGLTTRLAGNLNLSSSTSAPQPRLTGEIRTVRGTYKAYGQQLDIEEGVLRFAGPYDNPALDVLAIRPNLTQRVGVQITGTALLPRVRLYSEPELPDAEKLAWLVLGRSGADGGAESAMLQQAALALLSGSGKAPAGGFSQALGLDQLSVRGATTNADGSTATAATVTVGKRLSRDFYVAYERSLEGTLGTLYIFYDLSRRLTLRAQSGEQDAIDLIFTIRYD